ncbi:MULTISPECIES: LPS export ABC transporter periplasmic protein LptC [Gammaproteobacteria]|uniref:LPS export ABC transporter periplasmic protein LptC n=1 Tax=Gammaproteobacteria TaxID=1236 RepID=UPI000DCFD25A|nr:MULTISPECIES: LPS export ABC transporter periplasmic protein LptC [Gammaproteobacteria]RTE86350.1 LPS export ABC transporter periplasmic protein LptC [Aliidiomarina sp. B3213]TCZ91700.1 LPS export ABC transporter periplasmic protein LptC [Lysobacter sp. N42]
MNLRTILLILAISIVAIFLLWQPQREQVIEEESQASEQLVPDFIAENLETRIYDQTGRLSHRIQAQEMSHYIQQNRTELIQPIYTSYLRELSASTGNLWQISAELGEFLDDERLELMNSVQISNLSQMGYIQNIETQALQIDIPKREMTSSEPVQITGPQINIKGIGFRVDLESQQLELIEHVESIYYPSAITRD